MATRPTKTGWSAENWFDCRGPAARASPGCDTCDVAPRISLTTLGVASLERSYHFYKDGLGLPTTRKPEDGIVFFQTSGATLAL